MSYVRADGYRLKDPDDDAAFQTVVGDLQRLAIALFRGSQNAAYTLTPESASSIGAPVTSTQPTKYFSAFGAASGIYADPNPILWGTSTEDDPYSMYDATSGYFTAPDSGVVIINLGMHIYRITSLAAQSVAGIPTRIYVNGSLYKVMVYDFFNPRTVADVPAASANILLPLAVSAGDTVFTTVSSGGGTDIGFYNIAGLSAWYI